MNASQWSALKKQPDKAKKMLSALHMSPAYLKVSWSELDEGDQKKVSKWIAKNGSGWFEKPEPTSTPKGIKNVAPKHRKAAVKKESEGVLRKPMKREKAVRTVNNAEKYATEFLRKNPIELSDIDYYKGMAFKNRQNPHGIANAVWQDAWHKVGMAGEIMIIGSDGLMYDTPFSESGIIINQKYVKVIKENSKTLKGEKAKESVTKKVEQADTIKHAHGSVKISFLKRLVQHLKIPTEFEMVYGEDVKIRISPPDVVKLLDEPSKIVKLGKKLGDKADISDWEDENRKWKNYAVYAEKGEGIWNYIYTENTSKSLKNEKTPAHKEETEEIRTYKNYGLVWEGNTSKQGVTSIDYYRVEKNPPKDVSYQGLKSFHGDSAALYYSKSNKETYIVPRDSKEYLVHLRNEKVQDDSYSSLAKKAGIDLEGLYIDDTDGIRFRMLDGAFKGKTAFRCPEDYRGLVFNSDSKLSCGEHGSLTFPEKAIDLRKIGIDDKTTKWAEQQFESWLSEAKQEGFNTVAEYVDSLKGKDGDKGYAKYAELGRGLEETFVTVAKKIGKKIDEELAAEKKKSEPEQKKSATTTYLEGAYKSRLEAMDSSPIPLSNPAAEEITDAIEFAKGVTVSIIMHFDKVDVQMRFRRDSAGSAPSSLEIAVFDEDQTQMYHNKEYNMNLTAAEVFRIRDGETKALMERIKEEKEEIKKKDEAKAQEERKKKQFRFNKTTYALYLKTYPYGMAYFMNHEVHLPTNADPQRLTDKELDLINEVVAEGYDIISDTGVYTVEWFKERDEMERKGEADYEIQQEKEKHEKQGTNKPANKQQYFRVIQADGKTKKDPVKNATPFTYQGIEFFSHKEGRVWHASEATTGLRFAEGNNQVQAEDAAKAIIDRAGSDGIQRQIATAKENLEKILKEV